MMKSWRSNLNCNIFHVSVHNDLNQLNQKTLFSTIFQLGMNQLQLKQRTESLQNCESSLTEMSQKLRMAEENAEKEADRVKFKI